ncbi:MAG: ribonuclease D, partial [Pseudomonadota bacterium]
MTPITETGALAALCERLSAEPTITVDTEFLRDKTYWPKLCLVQLAGKDEAKAVDPLARGIDLTPLYDLMANPNVLKVFHAARQDIEIFLKESDRVPAPLFDTQIAAMVCGFGDSVGYETLVNKLARAQIDKSSRFTDWSLRPLTDKQLKYALSDVTHLRV